LIRSNLTIFAVHSTADPSPAAETLAGIAGRDRDWRRAVAPRPAMR
jgi:hypothetical protein